MPDHMHGTVLVSSSDGRPHGHSPICSFHSKSAHGHGLPLMNMLSYWFLLLASIIMLASLFVQTGRPAVAGPPIHRSAHSGCVAGVEDGDGSVLAAMAVFVISQLLAGLKLYFHRPDRERREWR